MKTKIEMLDERFSALQSDRINWTERWQDCADYTLPRRGNFLGPNVTQGESRTPVTLYDSTAIHANEVLASALHTLLTNPQARFFTLTAGGLEDSDRETKQWLQQTTRILHRLLNGSNFQTEAHEIYLDQGSLGTGVMFVVPDDKTVFRFGTKHLSNVLLAESHQGTVDTVIREIDDWSVRQIAQRFGVGNLSRSMREKLNRTPDMRESIYHAVYPRVLKRTQAGAGAMPFESIYWDREGKTVLEEGGFPEFPWLTPRWTKASGEVYGRSPALKAMPDIKMLNAMCRTTIKAAEKAVDPPLAVVDDAVISPVRSVPSGLTYIRPTLNKAVERLYDAGDVRLGLEMEEQRRASIRLAFFNDLLKLIRGPQMTATEVAERTEDSMRQLGPILGRQYHEFLRPMIARVMAIAFRGGQLPPMPRRLEENAGLLDVRYTSPIAQTQRQNEALGLVGAISVVSPLVAQQPQILDVFDGDAAARGAASLYSVPVEWLRDPDVVAQIRQQRAEAQAAAAQQEQANVDKELETRGGGNVR